LATGVSPSRAGNRAAAFSRISDAASGRTVQSFLVVLVDGGGSGDDLAVEGGEDEDALGSLRGDGQQDAVEEGPAGQLEDEELALARVDLEGVVADEPGDGVGVQSGSVDRHRAGEAFPVSEVQGQAVGVLVDAGDTGVGADGGAGADGGVGHGEGVGDGVGDGFAGDEERAVLLAHLDGHAVAAGIPGERDDGLAFGGGAGEEFGAAAHHRDVEGVEDGVAQGRGAQDQVGLSSSP
jgi:hypothetical protein